jgi:hypothetical protein
MRSYLADVNVWVAIADQNHLHHSAARSWFLTQDRQQICFCRFTQMGLLRLLTNRKVMGAEVLSQRGAWGVIDQFMANHRVRYVEEPAGVTAVFRELTQSTLASHGAWSDAYIAAVALCGGLTAVSFDSVFNKLAPTAVILG